jgi:hypothetical protein
MSEAGERRSVGGLVRMLIADVSWPAILSGGVAIALGVLTAIYNSFFMAFLALWFFWLAFEFAYAKFVINTIDDKLKKEAEEVQHCDMATKVAWSVLGAGGALAAYTLPLVFGSLFYYLIILYIPFSYYMNVFMGIENDIAGLLILVGIAITIIITLYINSKIAPDPEVVGI